VAIYTSAKALSRWPINNESTLTHLRKTSSCFPLGVDQAGKISPWSKSLFTRSFQSKCHTVSLKVGRIQLVHCAIVPRLTAGSRMQVSRSYKVPKDFVKLVLQESSMSLLVGCFIPLYTWLDLNLFLMFIRYRDSTAKFEAASMKFFFWASDVGLWGLGEFDGRSCCTRLENDTPFSHGYIIE
jgi:hypothetical protein